MGSNENRSGKIGEGGPAPFAADLEDLRMAAQLEAVTTASMDLDPAKWDSGQFAFQYEFVLAHQHEALRDRLANFVAARARDQVRGLYAVAAQVAVARDNLRIADRNLIGVMREWKKLHRDIQEDELELGRFARIQSNSAKIIKLFVALLFLGAETALSFILFKDVLARVLGDSNWIDPMGALLAIGIVVMLIVVPHYVAMGLKEGLTRHHSFEEAAYQHAGRPVPYYVQRKAHFEEIEDRGARITAIVLGVFLICCVIPLSILRAHTLDSNSDGSPLIVWFAFSLFLQAGISGYFFSREWMEHGLLSYNMKHHAEAKKEAETRRTIAYGAVGNAMRQFHDKSEDLVMTLTQAPRWDSYIVESFNGTVDYFRHIIEIERPDLGPFIFWARQPYLGSASGVDQSARPLDAVSQRHLELERSDAFGRHWWMETMSDALIDIPEAEITDNDDDNKTDTSWLITKSPTLLLREFLRRYFDMSDRYEMPPEINEPDEVSDREPPEDVISPHEPESPVVVQEPFTEIRVIATDDDGSEATSFRKGG